MKKMRIGNLTIQTKKTRLIRCLVYDFLFGEPKTSAGQAIWRQSFDKRQKNNGFWAHENNNISQRLSIERESKMQMRHVQKVYSDKIKSTVSFNSPM